MARVHLELLKMQHCLYIACLYVPLIPHKRTFSVVWVEKALSSVLLARCYSPGIAPCRAGQLVGPTGCFRTDLHEFEHWVFGV